jgi:hypothetical protein
MSRVMWDPVQRFVWFNLGAKLNDNCEITLKRKALPEVLAIIVERLCSRDYAACAAFEIPFTSHGSAFLQTLLQAASPNK